MLVSGVQVWSDQLTQSFLNLSDGVVRFVPNLLIAIILFVFGWFVGSVIGRWIAQLIHALKIDEALKGIGLEGVVSRAGFRLNAGNFVGALVKWFVIVVFLVASLEVLGLSRVTDFLKTDVLSFFLPNLIVAALILIVSALIAEALQKTVAGSARAAGITSAGFLGGLTKWAIWVFAVIIALFQIGIAQQFLLTLFTGVVAMLALAGGLSFGLGGRDAAGRYIAKLQDDMHGR